MAELAAVILAHSDPTHFRRLVRALPGVEVYLHCDAKTPKSVFHELVRDAPRNVHVLPRRATALASWSLVSAELDGVRAALSTSRATHVAVLSGADYPVVSMDQLFSHLDSQGAHTYLKNAAMPFAPWNTPRHADGGLWRLEGRFLVVRDRVVYLGDIPLRIPGRRMVPATLEFRASAHWKVYSREDATRLLEVAGERQDLVRFWRKTLVPEETFSASVLATRSLAKGAVLRPDPHGAWYMRWPEKRAHHPEWLDGSDWEGIQAEQSRRAEAGIPPLLFARKFSSQRSEQLLDLIDKCTGRF
ncbi:MAG: hypothetical protein JWP75_1076 [Frondihabitans sp.]|nr:hypothetical protein [Frondihabitans sp.]